MKVLGKGEFCKEQGGVRACECGDMGWKTGWDMALPADPAPHTAQLSLAVWRGQSRFSPEAQRRRHLGRGRGHPGWAELSGGH